MSSKPDLPRKPVGRRTLIGGSSRGIGAAIAPPFPDDKHRVESSHRLHATKGAGHESA